MFSKKYIIRFAVITGIMLIAAVVEFAIWPKAFANGNQFISLAAVSIISLALHVGVQLAIRQPDDVSPQYIMGAIGGHMFACLIYVGIGLMGLWRGDTAFAAAFMFFYVVYLLFELNAIMAILRPQTKG